ncbi:MAG: PTS glucose transporter subunit IIA [Defluviitaleaceae bacterium]|nr:PTS glucose transporter subunit IIA [Defluviitaleaceae bacterium]
MFGKLKSALGSEKKDIKIVAPLDGAVVALSEVADPAFAEEMLGRGIAIRPIAGRVTSPVNGKVTQMFDTGHAITLTSDEGVEILIHIGLDTVNLKGEYFTPLVKTGDAVKVGDGLINFDIEAIKVLGYDTITPVVICNSSDYTQFETHINCVVKIGDEIITLGG